MKKENNVLKQYITMLAAFSLALVSQLGTFILIAQIDDLKTRALFIAPVAVQMFFVYFVIIVIDKFGEIKKKWRNE